MKKGKPKTTVVHLRLPNTIVAMAEKIAEALDRPRSYVLSQAIKDAVASPDSQELISKMAGHDLA